MPSINQRLFLYRIKELTILHEITHFMLNYDDPVKFSEQIMNARQTIEWAKILQPKAITNF